MNNDIEEILDRFDRVLKNYELDKKIGNFSVDSIYHLFPNEMITIKNYITNLQEENKRLNNIIDELEKRLQEDIKEGRSKDNKWLMGYYDAVKDFFRYNTRIERR